MASSSAPPSSPDNPPVKDLKLESLMISVDDKYKDVKIGNGFSFLAPARVLKRAFHGLADLDFNPEGLGLMEVCQGGFQVTVCNDHVGPGEPMFGLLSFKAAGLKEFFCDTTMSRMITLRDIVGFLDRNATDDDFVKVFNAKGSNDLCFLLENELDGVPQRFPLEVPFDSAATTITKFPAFSYGFETDIPRDKLEPVLDSILALEPRKRPPHEVPQRFSLEAPFSSIGFSFLAPARVLKRAFHGLTDLEFNPEGLGLMEVCPGGFEITVCHDQEGPGEAVFGLLSLKAAGLKEFACMTIMCEEIKLVDIAGFLDKNASDDDVVRVFNFQWSNELCFFVIRTQVDPRPFSFEVPFSSNAVTITKFPAFKYGFETDIPRIQLESALDSILALEPRKRPAQVTLSIQTLVRINGAVTVDSNIFRLVFPFWGSLKKTITLADPCTLQLLTIPANSVALRFNLEELGDFMYLKYGNDFTQQLPPIGIFQTLFCMIDESPGGTSTRNRYSWSV